MSVKEVTELRKSGRLDEALTMARELITTSDDVWNYRALFWALYDIAKRAKNESDFGTMREMVAEMATLVEGGPLSEEDLAKKCYESMRLYLLPTDKRYEELRDKWKNGELGEDEQEQFAWAIYAHLRDNLERIGHKNARKALNEYIQLNNIAKPSIVHSQILRMAIAVEKAFTPDFKFTAFLRIWGFENFSEEDWEHYKTEDGKTMLSLVEKAIYKYVAEVKSDGINSVPDGFKALLGKAIEANPHNELLQRSQAVIAQAEGDKTAALQIYHRLAQQSSQSYIYGELAELTENSDEQLAALCKALSLQNNEALTTTLHLHLGLLLAERDCSAEAAAELAHYRRLRDNKSVDSRYYMAWQQVGTATPREDMRSFYREQAAKLDDFVYDNLEETYLIFSKFDTNKAGKKIGVLYSDDGGRYNVSAKLCERRQHLLYKARIAEVNGRKQVRTLIPARDESVLEVMPGLSRHEGIVSKRIDRKGNAYCFINGCYVPAHLLNNSADGEMIAVLAITQEDGRTRAVALAPKSMS